MLKRTVAMISVWGSTCVAMQPASCLEWGNNFQSLAMNGGTVRASLVAPTPHGVGLHIGGTFLGVGGVEASHLAFWNGARWCTLEPAVETNAASHVSAIIRVDEDGPGPLLPSIVIGGWFQRVGGTDAPNIARWDGEQWSTVGEGIPGRVTALCAFDDDGVGPGGPLIYAAGEFNLGGPTLTYLAKWDGVSWQPVPIQGPLVRVDALTTYRGELIVGGRFQSIDGVPASCIAAWNGVRWRGLGLGISATDVEGGVRCFATFDAGPGEGLVVGGKFEAAGGTPAFGVAMWDGQWSSLGAGIRNGPNSAIVNSLAAFDHGSGPRLYAGGDFHAGRGSEFEHLAVWDGMNWSAAGDIGGDVTHLAVFDRGDGPTLFVFGGFATVDGVYSPLMAEWDGARWIPRGQSLDEFGGARVFELRAADVGNGPQLFAGGSFSFAGGTGVRQTAVWNGREWSPLGNAGDGPLGGVFSMAQFPSGVGNPLYIGGSIGEVLFDGSRLRGGGVAVWDGARWTSVNSGLDGGSRIATVLTMRTHDDGTSEKLYLGGWFSGTAGYPLNNVARLSQDGWRSFDADGLNNRTRCAAVFDSGAGPEFFVGGDFTVAGGQPAGGVARWSGSGWLPVGSNLAGEARIYSLVVFDDGTGPALYASGYLTLPTGGFPSRNVAKWNGTSWEPMGAGIPGDGNSPVKKLLVYDSGQGPSLYALRQGGALYKWTGAQWSIVSGAPTSGLLDMCLYDPDGADQAPQLLALTGDFAIQAANGTARSIVTWDGTEWRALGSGLASAATAVGTFDDPTGRPRLVVGGNRLQSAGGVPVSMIASWDGSNWAPLGTGVQGDANTAINAISTFDDGAGPALYIGGSFRTAGGQTVNHVAKWDGARWSRPPGVIGAVYRLETLATPDGVEFIACGIFGLSAGEVFQSPNIVAWTGTDWQSIGAGFNADVSAMEFFDPDGPGPAPSDLYAAGGFTASASQPLRYIARWTGSDWVPVGGGVGGPNLTPWISALARFDDGSGEALYAAGYFTSAGGIPASSIARWNGTSWSALDAGPVAPDGALGRISSLHVYDDGDGPALYAAGDFTAIGRTPANGIAKWDGARWHALGIGLDGVASALETFAADGVQRLYVGGAFLHAGGRNSPAIASWGPCSPGCVGDYDQSGGIDCDDITAFFADWERGGADVDRSGGTDGEDVAYFFERWQAGC